MLLYIINDNIPIPHLSYPDVYKDEEKIEIYTKI